MNFVLSLSCFSYCVFIILRGHKLIVSWFYEINQSPPQATPPLPIPPSLSPLSLMECDKKVYTHTF